MLCYVVRTRLFGLNSNANFEHPTCRVETCRTLRSILSVLLFIFFWRKSLVNRGLNIKPAHENRFFAFALPLGCKEAILVRSKCSNHSHLLPFLRQKNFTSSPTTSLSSRLARRLVPRRSHWLVSHFSPSTSFTIV